MQEEGREQKKAEEELEARKKERGSMSKIGRVQESRGLGAGGISRRAPRRRKRRRRSRLVE